ncbi:MAG: aldo/keto reductase [Clostridia bacterium]|jgi:aryl-alcohol dehydrogenase-like predicted oxidoreductase|nr:aldo/keto reductase [Clostridia bacterium]
MEKTRLGRTGLLVTRSAFGALPIQRLSKEDAVPLLRRAYDSGINFYDTARLYTDSEEKIGAALSDVRKTIIISSKFKAATGEQMRASLAISLKNLGTDYIDIYQLHNPDRVFYPGEDNGVYDALLEAKKEGLIRFIGMTNHRLHVALETINSGLYDTVQYPLNYLSAEAELNLPQKCAESDIGMLIMKALSGGIITNAAASFAFLRQYPNAVPLWGIQKMSELEDFISWEKNPPVLNEKLLQAIKEDRDELGGVFCRGCGYCLPCAANIDIPFAARMSHLIRRSPLPTYLNEAWRDKMELITQCTDCGHCRKNCPYGLDSPALLRSALEDYRDYYRRFQEGDLK